MIRILASSGDVLQENLILVSRF